MSLFAKAGRFSIDRTVQNLKLGTGAVKLSNIKKITTQPACDTSGYPFFFNDPKDEDN